MARFGPQHHKNNVLIYLIISLYIALKPSQYLVFFIFRKQMFSLDNGRFLPKIPEKDKLCYQSFCFT